MPNGIIEHTLPTVVGMGVVARTAEIALTRRGRRAAAKHRTKGKRPKIHKGPRGGRYIICKGRRVYI